MTMIDSLELLQPAILKLVDNYSKLNVYVCN